MAVRKTDKTRKTAETGNAAETGKAADTGKTAETGRTGETAEPQSGSEPEKKPELSEVFAALDTLVEAMEKEESLEKSFALYKKGISLLQSANDSIDKIEKQVKVLDDDGILS